MLSKYADRVVAGAARRMIVVRSSNIWPQATKIWSRSNFVGKSSVIKVTFVSDEGGMEEDALDHGGPRREFFRILKRSMAKNSKLFVGEYK